MNKPEMMARQAEADLARDRFMKTLHELQQRLSPKSIAADVKEKAKEKADGAISAAKEGVAQAATHPSTIAAITVPIAMYLFRKPIVRGMTALLRRGGSDVPAASPQASNRKAAPQSTNSLRATRKAPAEQGA